LEEEPKVSICKKKSNGFRQYSDVRSANNNMKKIGARRMNLPASSAIVILLPSIPE
jgi:hypothetical protein